MKREDIISKEMAEEQLELLFDHYEIDDLAEEMAAAGEEKATAQAETLTRKLIKAIQRGRLEITDGADGFKITQRLEKPVGQVTEIQYGEVTGAAKVTIKGGDKRSPFQTSYDFLAAVSKQTPATFHRMSGKDLSTAECLFAVFTMA